MPKHPTKQHYDAALNVIRSKVQKALAKEPPLNKAEVSHRAYFERLVNSGATAEQVQSAWHAYYEGLSNEEKHNVWQEYYQTQNSPQIEQSQLRTEPGHITGVIPRTRQQQAGSGDTVKTVAEVKDQITQRVKQRAGAVKDNKHVRAIGFALSVGFLFIFLNFNELFIAQFKAYVSPGSQASTPVIIGGGQGQPVGPEPRIIIPKINLDIPVVYDQPSVEEAKVQAALERGAVHYADTAVPGQPGNNVLVGHSSNNILNNGKYKFAFVLINRLEINDTFVLHYQSQRYIYRVYNKKIVKPTEVSVLGAAAKSHTTTLITCDPPGTATNRLIVQAEQISPEPDETAAPVTTVAETPQVVPGNSTSLFQRFRNWLFH